MRNWRSFLFVLVAGMFLAFPGYADISVNNIQGDFDKLTQEQKAEFAKQIAATATAKAAAPQMPTVEKVEPWLELIDRLGQGLVRLAHDLGVEANQLLTTPVGVLTMLLVAYQVMGNDIMGILAGLLWFGLTFPIWLLYFYKLVIPIVEYKSIKRARWARGEVLVDVPIRRRVTFEEDSGPEWVATVSLVLLLLVTLIFIA